ncbi:hypothetical protein KSX62_15220 [Enterobacter hormaechei]|uniref:ABC-three component system protein n=1 Tax=Enterobacter TaxID=547 RepID=UPI0006429453|nr:MULTISPECIES: ABC-three component system protein [Enterobacter]KLR15360.1 hypothetical protein ABR27_10750 [Enterobacter hormaechei subsp. hormaechei]MBU8926382.1 hypothetical protein [Enterobacter hormaechei]MBU8930844.1 hypothetical protein [Enterobacter hormaechei]MBU8938076.1 hypothetical protein [Enterobacter hormaechei]MBU8947534.1 hypothetical protein [Enterobacter hormaechei]
MTAAPQDPPHTAISTWSGFVYQGKLALYHSLTLINSNYDAHRSLKLQLESQDDFAIYQDQQCLSIHQVKAYKEARFSAYAESLSTQRENALKRQIPLAYFHVARQITGIPATFEKDYGPVQFYPYPVDTADGAITTQTFCPLKEVDQYIQKQIEILLIRFAAHAPWKKNCVNTIQNALEAVVNKKVILVHSRIHESRRNQKVIAAKEFIEFSVLYEALETDDYDLYNNESYFLSRLQIDIGTYFNEFCELQANLPPAACSKLDDYLATIASLDAEGMKMFLRATMPHKTGRFATLNEFKDDSLDRDSMRLGMFTIFWKLISATRNEGTGAPFSWLDDGIFYYPTGIHQAVQHQESICHDIMRQAIREDVECLYECGVLITSAMDHPSIMNVIHGVDSVGDVDDARQEFLRDKRIGNFMKVGMVSLNNVPASLKDE